MLSYRHAYHAGNHADLLKHYLLTRTLAYYNQKPKPYDYIDTHAGAGYYDLTAAYAQKNREYQSGIARLNAAVMAAFALGTNLGLFLVEAGARNLLGNRAPQVAYRLNGILLIMLSAAGLAAALAGHAHPYC